MLYLDGKRHFDQTVACWGVELKPFSIQMPSSKCFRVDENNEWILGSDMFLYNGFWILNSPQALCLNLVASVDLEVYKLMCLAHYSRCFSPHVSLFYTLIIFPTCQCYSLSTVENEVNTPALLIITSFTSTPRCYDTACYVFISHCCLHAQTAFLFYTLLWCCCKKNKGVNSLALTGVFTRMQ